MVLTTILLSLSTTVAAGPFAPVGDIQLRHDIEYLADRQLVDIPITAWPISWLDISTIVTNVSSLESLDEPTRIVIERLTGKLAIEQRWGELQTDWSVAVADNRSDLRDYYDAPRGTFVASGKLEYVGSVLAVNVQGAIVSDGDDDQEFHIDGSYLAVLLGNWSFSAGAENRWWGPGYLGSAILSNNARPVPGVRLQRHQALRFENRFLNWIGPWTVSAFAGQLESDRFVSKPYLLGARFSFKPLRSLEFGISRTAQWGGDGRPESFSSLVDLILGRDNIGDSGVNRENEPGNQLAGFDGRYSRSVAGRPFTLYGQLIGEDEAGGFPSRYLGFFGLSTSFALNWHRSSVRVGVEYSDTTCEFYKSVRRFNCAYSSNIYRTGYRFRGRSLGYSTDNDASQIGVYATLNEFDDRTWSVVAKDVRLNRAGLPDPANVITPTRVDVQEVNLTHIRPFAGGKIEAAAGIGRSEDFLTGESDTDFRISLKWRSTGF